MINAPFICNYSNKYFYLIGFDSLTSHHLIDNVCVYVDLEFFLHFQIIILGLEIYVQLMKCNQTHAIHEKKIV